MREPSLHGPEILLIGFGNPGRLDDGLGPALVERLRSRAIHALTLESAYQPAVEHAALVAHYPVVVFADASLTGREPFTVSRLAPVVDPAGFTTHTLEPQGVLGLALQLYDARPVGISLAIRGYSFGGFGEFLGARATRNLDAAEAFVASLFEPGRADEAFAVIQT